MAEVGLISLWEVGPQGLEEEDLDHVDQCSVEQTMAFLSKLHQDQIVHLVQQDQDFEDHHHLIPAGDRWDLLILWDLQTWWDLQEWYIIESLNNYEFIDF